MKVIGKLFNLVLSTTDADRNPTEEFRSLLLQELLIRGISALSLVVGSSRSAEDIDRAVEAFGGTLMVDREVLESGGVEGLLIGQPSKPAHRRSS